MVERWSSFVFRARWFLALLWLVLAVGSATVLPELKFRFNLGQMLRGSDAQQAEIKDFYRTFPPADGHAMLTATGTDPLTVDRLRATADWAEEIRGLPEVKEVLSVEQFLELKLDGFTLDEWARLGGDGSELVELGDEGGMEAFHGTVVSRDLKSVALYVIKGKGVHYRQLHGALEKVTSVPWPGAEVRLVGPEYLIQKMGLLLKSDLQALLRWEFLALVVITPFFMRSLRRSYLPMLASLTALFVYLSIFILAGKEFGVIHLAGPGLILIIGLADAIHLQQKFDDLRAEGREARSALPAMFRAVGKACALTSLTTICGFLSLTVARHEEIHEFGVWCAIGVATSFVVVMLFMPVALVFFPGRGTVPSLRTFVSPPLVRRMAAPVMGLFVVLAAGMHRMTLDSSLDRELPRNVPAVRDVEWFAENFRGLDRIEVDLQADLKDPEVFALVEKMQADLRDFPGIAGSRSYVDAVRMTLSPDVIETEAGPMLGTQALNRGGGFPAHLLNRDLDRACIVFYRKRGFGTEAFDAFKARIRDYAAMFPEGSSLKLNGRFPMFYESTRLISSTLALSLTCSILMITVILMVVFRSVRLGLLCLVPNAVPLLVVAGILGWMNEPLHLGLLIVFSVALGLAVDDTIHFMVRYKQLEAERPGEDTRVLIDAALRSAGFAIVLTSVVLLISAVCFFGSNFTTMRWVGVTLSIVAVSALLADLIVLPWLLEKSERARVGRLEPVVSS